MSAPSTIKEFLALVCHSGLADEAAINAFFARQRLAIPLAGPPASLAALLVRGGMLTQFQADQLLNGKWQRFDLGRYRVLEPLGAGGMAQVFLCEHRYMKRKVAVKVLPTSHAKNQATRERFYREGRAVAALDHPNIVRAFDISEEGGLHFLAMEYVEGASLQDIIKTRGPLSALQAMHYMRQAALGLEHAYQAKLIHRDVKPGNLLVDLTGTVKVLDLGLARFFKDDKDDLSLRHDERVLGTADYMAPESALDARAADIRSDIYSLGCTIYFCLTGVAPFGDGTTMAQKLIWHQTRQPRPIEGFRGDVSAEFTALIQKAMAKDPAQRWQSPAELARALGNLLRANGETAVCGADKTLAEGKAGKSEARRRRRRQVFGAVAALVMSGLGYLLARLFGAKATDAPAPQTRPTGQAEGPAANMEDAVQL